MKTILIFLVSVHICAAGQPKRKSGQSIPDEQTQYFSYSDDWSYEDARAKQAGEHFFAAGHDKEFRVDLNGDGNPEIFLLGIGHIHWGDYSVYSRSKGKWVCVGGVRSGGHPPVLSATKRSGWHDFSIDTDGSRGLLQRTFYRWNATLNRYVNDTPKTIRPMDSEEP